MKMLIGLTGKTGSGKSTAAEILTELGCYVADCDKIAHEILFDDDVKKKLCDEFSDAIIDGNNNIDRKKLGSIVFSDEKKLSLLNSITHKIIVDKALDICKTSGKDICVLDGSELESSGIYKKCAYIIVITASEKVRLERIMKRDVITKEQAMLRIRAQKDCGIDAIFVDNDGDYSILKSKIAALYDKFSGELYA